MTAGIYLDHVLIAVRSLSSAAESYSSLGFKVTPEGRHPGRGTHNRLMVFGPEYLELIAVHDPTTTPFRPSMSSFLESREGLYMFALGTSDIDGTVRAIRSLGIDVGAPVAGRRDAGETPGYTWKSANLGGAMPGSECFLIQHDHTVAQRYTLPPDPTAHENGVTGIHHVTLAVHDADAAARSWQEVLGVEPGDPVPANGGVRRRIALDNARIDLESGSGPGPLADFLRKYGEGPFELGLETPDIEATASAIRSSGATCEEVVEGWDGPSSLVHSSCAADVRLRLVQV